MFILSGYGKEKTKQTNAEKMGKSKELAIKSTKEKVIGLKWYKLFHQKLYWLRKKTKHKNRRSKDRQTQSFRV